MMQLIAFIIFSISLLGIVFMLLKKIPALVQLPQHGDHGFKKNNFILNIEGRLKDFHFDFFHKQVWLHRLLSKVRVWLLKLERNIGERLHGIRKKSQQIDKDIKEKK